MIRDEVLIWINDELIPINNIISVVFNDMDGYKSDKLDISFLPSFKKPKPKDKIEIKFLRYEYDLLTVEMFCGSFYVQSITRKNNQGLSVSATSINFHDNKEVMSHTYVSTTLEKIIFLIAQRMGYNKVQYDMPQTLLIDYLHQDRKSDISFLSSIAEDYDVLFSIKNDVVYFVSRSSDTLPTFRINANNTKSIDIKTSYKTFYKSAKTIFRKAKIGKGITATTGDGSPILKVDFINQQNIKYKLKARLDKANRGITLGSLCIDGLKIYAGTKLFLSGTYGNENDNLYSIESCKHTWSLNGWICDVNFGN